MTAALRLQVATGWRDIARAAMARRGNAASPFERIAIDNEPTALGLPVGFLIMALENEEREAEAVPFNRSLAAEQAHENEYPHEWSDEQIAEIVDMAAERYNRQPSFERDGDQAWCVSWAAEKFIEMSGDDGPREGERDWMGNERSW